MDTPLGIDEVVQRTGLSAHTLRYYERIGLIAPVSRAAAVLDTKIKHYRAAEKAGHHLEKAA